MRRLADQFESLADQFVLAGLADAAFAALVAPRCACAAADGGRAAGCGAEAAACVVRSSRDSSLVHMEGACSWKKKRKKIGSDVPDAGRAAGCGAAEACGRGGRVKRTVTSESIDAELLTVGNSGGSGVGEVI